MTMREDLIMEAYAAVAQLNIYEVLELNKRLMDGGESGSAIGVPMPHPPLPLEASAEPD